MIVYYYAVFIASVILSLIYAAIWQKHFDVQITIVFVLIPINNLGYLMLARAENIDQALTAMKILYLGGAFLIPFILFLVFDMCHLNRFMKYRVVALIVSMSSYFFVLTLGTLPLFYKKTTYNRIDGVCVLTKEYGILHTVFFVIVGIYFVMCLTAIIYSYIRKPNVSRHILRLMFFPAVVTLICYIIGRMGTLEFVPAGYVFAQIMYLLIIRRMLLYDITESGVDSLVNMNTTGFISFDRKLRYIGCNETAAEMFPFLGGLKVDYAVDHDPVMRETVLKWIEDFRDDETKNSVTYPYGERIYLVSINNLCFRGRKKGYQLFITDNTVDQKYIALLDGFNSELKEEVEKKTVGLEYMQNRVILGMAVMVESRDNSTGGHIRRTSDVMKILTDEIMKDNTLGLSEVICEKLVKAAPMHDLGKIAVDDAILRKPGRFTPEEFEKMKTHAPEGARIIHTILEGTDDREFARIAEAVAHYHHERWDGSGYPDGLKGEQIPIEARIMAIADVYDALVSKRVYKESMSFEKADAIIMDSMGKHFDKRLEKYYVRARPRLEEYYSKAE